MRATYHVLLDREPDEEGLRTYARALREGMSYLEFVTLLIDSQEYSSRRPADPRARREAMEPMVRAVYITLLHREPTAAERMHYGQSGMGLDRLVTAIASLPEFDDVVHRESIRTTMSAGQREELALGRRLAALEDRIDQLEHRASGA